MTYTFFPDLSSRLPDIPQDSIVSRTLFSDETTKVVLFGFAAGEELSEHTASRPAIIHFLEGEAELILGEDVYQVSAGAWAHMPPHLPHSIVAKTRVTLLLTLL